MLPEENKSAEVQNNQWTMPAALPAPGLAMPAEMPVVTNPDMQSSLVMPQAMP